MMDETRAKQAVRLSTQIICEMLIKRKLRPRLLAKSIGKAITIYQEIGRNMETNIKELELAKTFVATPAINADVIIFRFFRAIPVTKRSKNKLLKALQTYRPENTKKWRVIPRTEQISRECSNQAKRHVEVLLHTIKDIKAI